MSAGSNRKTHLEKYWGRYMVGVAAAVLLRAAAIETGLDAAQSRHTRAIFLAAASEI